MPGRLIVHYNFAMDDHEAEATREESNGEGTKNVRMAHYNDRTEVNHLSHPV